MDILSKLHSKTLFSPQDVAQITGNMRSAQTLLLRYQDKGLISKIRRGLYCVNNIATHLPEANKFQIGCAITPSSYIAYHAAMEYHGLAHQIYFNVSIGGEQAFNHFDFDGNHFHFHRIATHIYVDTPIADSHVRVTNIERTIVDCIDRIDLCGGWEELINCLHSVQYIREEIVIAILEAYNKIALYKKLGFLFEQLQLPKAAAITAICQPYAKESVTYMTSDGDSDTFNATWRIYFPHNLLTINQQNTDELV